jgi:tetratricopeptide (TPR) repeat protein
MPLTDDSQLAGAAKGAESSAPNELNAAETSTALGSEAFEQAETSETHVFEEVESPETPASTVAIVVGCTDLQSGLEELQAAFNTSRAREVIREAFSRLVKTFPTANAIWYSWAQYELLNGEYEELESLFTRCLKGNLSVPLWRLYLAYVRGHQLPPLAAEDETLARQTMLKAYEFAVSHVGFDVASGVIWQEYIAYAQHSYERVMKDRSGASYEQQQLMDLTRKAYQRALSIPIQGLEQLWQAYDAFENSLNKVTAKKLIADKSSAYMAARSSCRELVDLIDALDLDDIVDYQEHHAMSNNDKASLAPWLAWIDWERGNPMRLGGDRGTLHSRIVYAFRRSLMPHRRNPTLWLRFINYLRFEAGKLADAETVAKQALRVCPLSAELTFSLVDLSELKGSAAVELDTVRKPLDALIAAVEGRLEVLKGEIFESQSWELDELGEASFASQLLLATGRSLNRASCEPGAKVDQARWQAMLREYTSLRGVFNSALVQLLGLCRRLSGLNSARAVFANGRKSAHADASLFNAAAELEFRFRKDASIATKIYELGLARFPTDWTFARRYLRFLLALNDDSNIRALFERIQANLETFRATHHRDLVDVVESDSQVAAIWSDFYEFERQVGDQESIVKLETRMRSALPCGEELFSPLNCFNIRFGISLFGDSLGEGDFGESETASALHFTQRRSKRSLVDSLPSFIPESLFSLILAVQGCAREYNGPEIDIGRFIRFVERVNLPSLADSMSRSLDTSPSRRPYASASAPRRFEANRPAAAPSSSSGRRRYRDHDREEDVRDRRDSERDRRDSKQPRSSLFEERRRQ